jgi:osmotically inducible protein OsmC
MPVRTSEATWKGTLREGNGEMVVGDGVFKGPFTYATRFEEQPGTNPEELLGAAHAGCFAMSVSSRLTAAGHPPKSIHASAKVHLGKVEGKSRITKIELDCETSVDGVSQEKFLELAEDAKINCPVSAALTGVEITLNARLV